MRFPDDKEDKEKTKEENINGAECERKQGNDDLIQHLKRERRTTKKKKKMKGRRRRRRKRRRRRRGKRFFLKINYEEWAWFLLG